jgi:DNA-binding MarR family transcriptional regulator
MFYLKDLPTDRSLSEFAARYSNINPSALKTCAALMRTGSDLLTAFEKILGNYGLSQGRFLTLSVMNRTPDEAVNPSSLADKLGVTRATMTGLLGGLEKNYLVERLAHPGDRRKTGIRLTARGRQILAEILPDYYRNMARAMANLTEKERQELASQLKKVDQGLSSI